LGHVITYSKYSWQQKMGQLISKPIENVWNRGVFVTNPETLAQLEESKDPLLVQFALQLRKYLTRTLSLDLFDVPTRVILDSALATEILNRSIVTPWIGPGIFKYRLFRDFAPHYVSTLTGDDWVSWRRFHENLFHFTGHCMGPPRECALYVIQEHIFHHFTNVCIPQSASDFASLKALASHIVFGVDESDLLITVLKHVQSPSYIKGESAIPGDILERYWALLHIIGQDPLPMTLAHSGKTMLQYMTDKHQEFTRGHPDDKQDLAHQFTVWFVMLNNIFTVILPISLAIFCLDKASQVHVFAEILDDQFDISSEETHLNAFVLETLRLYGPVFVLERQINEAITLDNVQFMSGEQLILPLSLYLRDPECYPQPNAFNPSRWFGNVSGAKRLCQHVFTTGTQTCPAQHTALFTLRYALYMLLSRYDYALTSDLSISLQNMPAIINPFHLSFAVCKKIIMEQ
jgi:hypothetical protein